MRRTSLFLIAVLMVLTIFAGCKGKSRDNNADTASTAENEEKNEFLDMWQQDGYEINDPEFPALFPKDTESLEVVNMFSKRDENGVDGVAIQNLLSVKYDDKAYQDEITRLVLRSEVSHGYDETSFALPAYVTMSGNNLVYEYALVDSDNIIHYVYLQNIPEDGFEIDEKYRPNNYEVK